MSKKLPVAEKQERNERYHGFHLEVPIELWEEMITTGLTRGQVAQWARDAFREKLERDKTTK